MLLECSEQYFVYIGADRKTYSTCKGSKAETRVPRLCSIVWLIYGAAPQDSHSWPCFVEILYCVSVVIQNHSKMIKKSIICS